MILVRGLLYDVDNETECVLWREFASDVLVEYDVDDNGLVYWLIVLVLSCWMISIQMTMWLTLVLNESGDDVCGCMCEYLFVVRACQCDSLCLFGELVRWVRCF